VSGWENPRPPAAPSGGGVVLAQTGVTASHTGDLLEAILATIALPAGVMLANGIVTVTTSWQQTGAGATSPLMRLRLGPAGSGIAGSTILSSIVGGAAAAVAGEQVWMLANAGAANVQAGVASTATNVLTVAAAGSVPAGAVDTTQPCEIYLTGQLATAGNTIALKAFLATLYPQA
jgi:hypothetical protein